MKKLAFLSFVPLLLCSGCGSGKVFMVNWEIEKLPSRTVLNYGEEVNTQEIVIRGDFADGTSRTLEEGKDYTIEVDSKGYVIVKFVHNPHQQYKLPFRRSFLGTHTISLQGGASSKADEVTKNIYNAMIGKEFDNNIDGHEKFFLVYSSETCELCNNLDYPAFLTDKPFFVIDCSEETEDTTEDNTAFAKYLSRNENFFSTTGPRIYDTAYFTNGFINETDVGYFEIADPDNFLTPTILLVELDGKNPGVTELAFGARGETDIEKKQFLLDMWDHKGKFSF